MADPAETTTPPAPAKTTTTQEAARTVPWERFKTVNDRVKALESDLEAKGTELQTLTEKAATADTLASQLEKLKGEHKTAAAAWAEERGLLAAGVTDAEDVELVRFIYGRLPAEGKPKTVGEYLTGLRAEGAVVPKGLQHLFGETTTTTIVPPPKITPPKAGGDGTPPGSGGKVAPAALRGALAKFQEGRMTAAELKALTDASRAGRGG